MVNSNYVKMWIYDNAPEEIKKLYPEYNDPQVEGHELVFLFTKEWLMEPESYIPLIIECAKHYAVEKVECKNGDVVFFLM